MTAPKIINGHKIVAFPTHQPTPHRGWDWCATLDSYDGAPDSGWQPMGSGETEQAAIADLLQQIEENDDVQSTEGARANGKQV